eukprot:2798859-Pleurochrysis_carterae.AAC.1
MNAPIIRVPVRCAKVLRKLSRNRLRIPLTGTLIARPGLLATPRLRQRQAALRFPIRKTVRYPRHGICKQDEIREFVPGNLSIASTTQHEMWTNGPSCTPTANKNQA